MQEQLTVKKSFLLETHGEKMHSQKLSEIPSSINKINLDDKSPQLSAKIQLQKRQAAKFRSMDLSSGLGRAASLKTEERIIVNPKNDEE